MAPFHEIKRLKYAKWSEKFNQEKPYTIVSHMPWLEESHKTNISFMEGPEELITDVRGREAEFTLDTHGFAYVPHVFPDFDVLNQESVEKQFQPQAEAFLKKHVEGVDLVHFFDHRVRLNDPSQLSSLTEIPNRTQPLPPASGVHIDQSPAGALKRVRAWMGDRTDFLLRGRVRILNIWFPYDYPITDAPLALCDGSTIREEDMLAADHVTRTYIGETVYPLFNPQAKWYYLSEQRRDEVLVFKIFDSNKDVPARYVPHLAFNATPRNVEVKPRKSFEIRALVFTYPPK